MRILSQGNRKYDLQYENVVLEKMTDSNAIYAYTGTGKPFKMASYSSPEKMGKAMDMLHEKYREVSVYPFANKNDMIRPKTFQFPDDYEIEV